MPELPYGLATGLHQVAMKEMRFALVSEPALGLVEKPKRVGPVLELNLYRRLMLVLRPLQAWQSYRNRPAAVAVDQ